MAKGNFGERLKRERELREVSQDELSTATRIGPRFLEALENEEWARLPGGIFNRGYVRAIAKYLGLDEEKLLAEYDVARGDLNPPVPPPSESQIPRPPIWITIALVLTALVVLSGLIVGGIYTWRHFAARRAARKTASVTNRQFEVTAAGSSAVLLELNGKAMPPIAAPGASGTITLSQKDLRWAPSGTSQP